jgi:hypothetical protein
MREKNTTTTTVIDTASNTTADHDGRAVFARSKAGIVGTNPIQGMDVCVYVYSVSVLSCV